MNEVALPAQSPFIQPDIFAELGEFQRVGELYGIDSATLMYVAEYEGELVPLSDVVWENLENTDSKDITAGDWATVEHNSIVLKRNYTDLRDKLQAGKEIDAPIIMRYKNSYHLVSGNTRLMVARALSMRPRVLLFEVFDNEAGI